MLYNKFTRHRKSMLNEATFQEILLPSLVNVNYYIAHIGFIVYEH